MAIKTGTAGNDTLFGTADADTLNGLAGNDILSGGKGADFLVGGAGIDTAQYSTSTSAVLVNLLFNTANGGDATGDTFREIENVTGSNFADQIIANSGDNVLKGLAGDDKLFGLAGNDTLAGGAGADKLQGDKGFDTADYSASSQAVSINLLFHTASGGDATGDTFDTIEGVTGSAFNDLVTADGGVNVLKGLAGNDILLGLAGNDTLVGGAGADKLQGDNGFDVVDYSGSSQAVVVSLVSGTGSGGDAEGDTLDTIEALDGSAKADGFFGDDADNQLRGFGGGDYIEAAGGADTLSGGDNDDILSGGAGGDRIDGGKGRDLVLYNGSDAGVTVNLEAGTASGGDAQGDTLVSIEDVFGTRSGDSIFGNAAANALLGDFGNDVLDGGGGADVLDGNFDIDAMTGGAGADTFQWIDGSHMGFGLGGRDRVTDFQHADGDKLDVQLLDAKFGTAGGQAFSFIGDKAFTAEGQIRAFTDGVRTIVELNDTGSVAADHQIELTGDIALVAGDFIL